MSAVKRDIPYFWQLRQNYVENQEIISLIQKKAWQTATIATIIGKQYHVVNLRIQ